MAAHAPFLHGGWLNFQLPPVLNLRPRVISSNLLKPTCPWVGDLFPSDYPPCSPFTGLKSHPSSAMSRPHFIC